MEIKTGRRIQIECQNSDKEWNNKWVSLRSVQELRDELRIYLNFQFDKMDDLRLMYRDLKEIQDKHWDYLYLGNLSRIGITLNKVTKEIEGRLDKLR